MHQDSIKLWFRDILNWLDMIKSVISTPCIRGKEKSTIEELTKMEVTGAEKGMFSEAEYNPVGSYIKYFDLDKSMCGKRIHICFEGVEEAMYLWLNGQFVGYAEDSFTPSEFDLTPYIKEKGNVLAVQVHKMSTKSIFRGPGLFPLFWNL